MWFLSPSGWPTSATDGSLFAQSLFDRGWLVMDASEVQAAIDAYNAGQVLVPTPPDYVDDDELAAALEGLGGGAVDSVNGQTGTVALTFSDVGAVSDTDLRLSDARTPTTHSHTASQVSDSTATGRSVLTAASAAAARTAIGLATVATTGAYDDLIGKPAAQPYAVRTWDPTAGTWSARPAVPTVVPVVSYSALHVAATPPPGSSPGDVWMLHKDSPHWPAA